MSAAPAHHLSLCQRQLLGGAYQRGVQLLQVRVHLCQPLRAGAVAAWHQQVTQRGAGPAAQVLLAFCNVSRVFVG